MKVRRPSFASVVALLALFVALDGPSHAIQLIDGKHLRKGSVTSRAIKDRSLKVRDLGRPAVRQLKAIPNGSVTETKLRNRSVTAGKILPGAVGSAAIADRSVGAVDLALGAVGGSQLAAGAVGTSAVADGSLRAQDIARFYGRFAMNVPAVPGQTCWSGAPVGLAAERAGADISRDLVVVTPDSRWPEDRLSLTVQNDGHPSRFVITACNPTAVNGTALEIGFRYIVVDLP